MYGNLSQSSVESIHELYDFTRCVRPDGSVYGSRGKCRKGTEQAAPEKVGSKLSERGKKELRKILKEDLEGLKRENFMFQSDSSESLRSLKQTYSMLRSVYFTTPGLQNTANRARLINLRLEIWRKEKAEREKKKPRDSKEYEAALRESPKYKKTPGSSKPIPKPSEADTKSLAKEQERLFAKMDRAKTQEEKLKISQQILDVTSRLQDAEPGKTPKSLSLREIYEAQGFNAKPELVGTVADLRSRSDIRTHSDGSPMILYRGVSTPEFSEQFKGVGPNGAIHFPGRGIHGNGSYAATRENASSVGPEAAPLRTARAYAGDPKDLNQKVTAFALRADANVVTFPPGTMSQRFEAYDKWEASMLREAEAKTGYSYRDTGEAAAALGIHAYQVPQNGEEYFVILNRGAVIAAMDSGISDD